jgi:hypothetical protein
VVKLRHFPPSGGLDFSAFFRKALKKKDPVYPVNPVYKEIRSNPYLTKIIVGLATVPAERD